MIDNLTDKQLERLPKYAQEYIEKLQRAEREVRVKLIEWSAKQDKTNVWTNDRIDGEYVKRYFRATDLEIEHRGVQLSITGLWAETEDIQLAWRPAGRSSNLGSIGLIPTSHQQVKLANLAFNQNELTRLLKQKQHYLNGENDEQ